MNTYIKQYFDIITFMIFMFVMHIANVEYNIFYKVVLVFLGYLLLKYALMRFLHKMGVEFIFLSLTFLLLLPKYPPEVGHYVVSGKVISKYIIKSGKPHIRDKYICKFVFTNVEGKSEVLEREDKYLYDNCSSQSYIIFETPLARKGYIDVFELSS